MAVYNELQVGRYVRFLQKFLSIKGRQPAPLTFSGELGAYWSLFHGVENRNLEGWNRFGSSNFLTASVGNFTALQIRNPKTSNVIAVIEKIQLASSDASGRQVNCSNGATTTDLASSQALTGTRFDPRGNPQPSTLISTEQAAGTIDLANLFLQTFVGVVAGSLAFADLILTENQEITILPGDAYRFRSAAANVGLVFTLWWRERLLEESERA